MCTISTLRERRVIDKILLNGNKSFEASKILLSVVKINLTFSWWKSIVIASFSRRVLINWWNKEVDINSNNAGLVELLHAVSDNIYFRFFVLRWS